MADNIEDIAIKRGDLYGGIVNKSIVVHQGSPKGYPEGDSILWKLHEDSLEDMIALLTAIKIHRNRL